MKAQKDNKVRKGVFDRHRILRYGMLILAVLMAAVIAVQMVPGGTEDSSAATVMITLDEKKVAAAGEDYSWSGDTLTLSGYGNN